MGEYGTDPLISAQTLPLTRWRNGGGTTREIVTQKSEDGQGFDWRLSLAVVDENGPFSRFPGMERIFTVVEGDSIALTVDGRVHRVAHGVPFRFSGDASVRATLPRGAVQVLNVITRSAEVSAAVVVNWLAPGRSHPVRPGQHVVLLAGRAILTADGAEYGMGVHDTARCGGAGDAAIAGEGPVAVVSFRPGSAP